MACVARYFRDGTLESINTERRATAMSVAAPSLYEQNDPERVAEPEGVLLVGSARYEEIDDRRTRVSGAQWIPAPAPRSSGKDYASAR
jgi:hypothetical protein